MENKNEKVRGDIEKLLWEYYDPELAPNMEELAGKIMEKIDQIRRETIQDCIVAYWKSDGMNENLKALLTALNK